MEEYDVESILDMYEESYVPEPSAMAQDRRIGFYKGEKVVKSHGKQIKDLTEAGESSVSIAKKLDLKQQTVNAAMDAMDKGIAGEEFKLNKPRKDIIKKNVNQTGINLKDPKHLEEIIKYIDDNPNANQKDAVKIFGRRKAELVDAKFYGSPGKKWSDEKAKLRNKKRLELTKERSSPSLEAELGAPKKSGLNFHHAGFKESLADLKNTMYIPGGSNRKMVKLFEDPLLKEMESFIKVFDDPTATTKEKQKAATNYLKNDRTLRQKYPEFKNFKTRLSFRRTAFGPGIMFKEKLPDSSLAISQEPGMTLKGETPTTSKGKALLEIAKENLKKKTGSEGVTLGSNFSNVSKKLAAKSLGDLAISLGSPTALLGLNAYLGVDPRESLDRAILGGEAALAPAGIKALMSRLDNIKNPLVRKSIETAAGLRLPGVFTPANVMRAARFASPVGIATLAGEGLYQLGKLGYEEQQRINAMSPEEKAEYLAEQQQLADMSA